MEMLNDNILVKKIEESGSKVMVASHMQKKDVGKGEVIEVGPGQGYGLTEFQRTIVKKGDIVYYMADQALKVVLDKQEYYVTREREVLLILK